MYLHMAKWLIIMKNAKNCFGAKQECLLHSMDHSQQEQQQQKRLCLISPIETYFFTPSC